MVFSLDESTATQPTATQPTAPNQPSQSPDQPTAEPARNIPATSPDSPNTSIDTALALQLPCPDMPADSIFNMPAFPNITNVITFSPADIKKTLDDFSCAPGTFEFHCKQNHIRYNTVMMQMGIYDEIRMYYERAQALHAEIWAGEVEQIADNESRDLITVEKSNPKTGVTCSYQAPNMAAARRDDLRVRTRFMLMERLSARYRPKSETINRNLNINVNAKPPDIYNVQASDL
jgi:hypothetical protein